MSEIRILNLRHKKSILVDIYRQSLLNKKSYLSRYLQQHGELYLFGKGRKIFFPEIMLHFIATHISRKS